MATPITFPTLPQGLPYCSPTDVTYLLGNLASSISSQTLSSAIAGATKFVSSQTNRSFAPRRVVKKYDGNGRSRMVLADDHVICINQLSVYFSYPLSLSRVAGDYDLLIDRPAGIISFPVFVASPIFAPFAQTFFRASANVLVDSWHGFTSNIYGEVLTTSDNQSYAFPANTVVRHSADTTAYPFSTNTPPSITPLVYLNGNLVTNTSYVQVTSVQQAPTPSWEIVTDNLVYTLTSSASGITGIRFNSANSPSDIVTADFSFWSIPDDVRDATAKKAAITILQGAAQTGFSQVEYMGAVQVAVDGFKIQYGPGGAFDGIISQWNSDIAAVIKQRKKPFVPYGLGFSDR